MPPLARAHILLGKAKARLVGQRPRGMPITAVLEFYSIPEPNSGCLLWLGACDGHGAAFVDVAGRQVRAARLAWEEKNGPLPSGAYVLHKCDNPGCINADHLFLGTQADNMSDKVAKGRQSKGTAHVDAMLRANALHRAAETGELRIMAIADDPRPLHMVATDFGVTPRTIRILKRKIAKFRQSLLRVPAPASSRPRRRPDARDAA